ncbi:MAG: metallophosphoesterase [Deferribacteraceae bacterium]|jgi:putative phosphoesterase|nr:metallophosphoesterase [Deferribacteraceae bacterium]
MTILIISDTHVKRYDDLPEPVQGVISSVDAIIHAGDIGSIEFYNDLKARTPNLYAVKGNNDHFSLPLELVITLNGVKIALTHSDRVQGSRENYLSYYFSAENPDLIIFGHTHNPLWVQMGAQTLLNPGSPTRNRGIKYNTFVLMTITDGKFEIEFKRAD